LYGCEIEAQNVVVAIQHMKEEARLMDFVKRSGILGSDVE